MRALLVAPAAALAVAPAGPTAAQIARAVAAAERSSALWATVNDCGGRGRTGVIGIRGQMPALGFPARLEMTISLSYYSPATRSFRPVPHAGKQIALGSVTSGTVQDGAAFRFKPPVRLQGTVTFTWIRGGRTIGTATRATSGGHPGVEEATPAGFSAATCMLRG